MLYELTQDLGNSLSLQEALAFVGVRMKRLIPYETIAVYIRRDEKLIPEYVSGENLRLFTSLEIPLGQGLSGWVAENNKPLLNGNPSVEAGYLNDPTKYSTLRSALAVPLNGVNGPARRAWRFTGPIAMPSAKRTCAFCWPSAPRWRWPSKTR